jgi:hypothetical protein
VRFVALPPERADVLGRAVGRAHELGTHPVVSVEAPPDRMLQDADVLVWLTWPPAHEPHELVLAAMTARKPVVVLDTSATAEWPALDPQTWHTRGFTRDAPIVVSIDPRDEEHSLVLAIQRLASDAELRTRLADAAQRWAASRQRVASSR